MSLATARAAVAEALRTIPDLNAYEFPQQNANLPMAHVLLDTIDPDFVMDDDRGRCFERSGGELARFNLANTQPVCSNLIW